MQRRSSFAIAAAVAVFAHAACAAPPRTDGLRPVVEQYRSDLADLDRFHSLSVATSGLDRFDRFTDTWRERLDALDFAALDSDAKVDAILLRDHLEHQARERAGLRAQLARDAAWLPFRDSIASLEDERRKLAPVTGADLAARFAAITEQVKTVEKNLVAAGQPVKDLPELAPPRALLLARQVDELRGTFERYSYHYLGWDPQVSWWIERPAKELNDALRSLGDKLRRDIGGKKGQDDDPLVGEPIGRDRLVSALERERIGYSPEEVLAIGERQLAWCDEQMLEEAKALSCATIAEALERVKSDHVPPGEQDDLVRGFAEEAIALLDANDLLAIPELCRETWRVDMMSESDQRVLPFAAYGGQCMVVNYASEGLSQAEKRMRLRDNNRHFTRIVTPHELIPGHHLQGFEAQRRKPWRRIFATPFIGEGWCLYWEFRFLEMGWGRTPQERLGILFWRRHRAARIVVSLSYHLEKMQPKAMIDFLRDRVGMDESAATGEVRRYLEGGYGPLYQCAYMIGGLQLRALQREACAKGAMTERAFHDAVLEENSIPIELIRARILGLPLEEAAPASWRFDED